MNKNIVALALLCISLPVLVQSMTPQDERLIAAAFNVDMQQVKVALDEGANINAVYIPDPSCPISAGYTVLHIASEAGNADMVKFLLKSGADATIKDNEGNTPLHVLANMANVSNESVFNTVNLLLVAGVDINAVDNGGGTALHTACVDSDVYIIKLLLEKGAHINAVDNDGQTALHIACEHSNEEVVKLLLEKGAHVTSRDTYGNTPLHYATEYHDYYRSIINQASNNAFNKAALLIEANADINALNSYGYTPLFNALYFLKKVKSALVKYGSIGTDEIAINIVKLLIESGARRDLYYNSSNHEMLCTIVDIAKLWKQQEIISFLTKVPSLKNLSARVIRNVIRKKQVALEQVKNQIPTDLHGILETNSLDLH